MSKSTDFYAIDFGTSNSLLSYVNGSGVSELIKFNNGKSVILRSLIYTPNQSEWYFGEEAIRMREENDGEGRFFRSIKKFLAEPNFKGTEVHGKIISIEILVSKILKYMKTTADKKLGINVTNVVLGRPARYSLSDENDKLAQDRMYEAAKLAGFEHIVFCPEPLAAGLNVTKSNLQQNVLIADFGGGTSDFTILKTHTSDYSSKDVLGMSGVFLAGDALDGQMMKDFISKHFGSEIKYQIPFNENILTFPRKLMLILASPAHIGLLKEKETWELLKEIQNYSLNDEFKRKLDQLFALVEYQLAYPIYSEIEKTKIELSSKQEAIFDFNEFGIKIHETINEAQYQESVSSVISKIKDSLMESFSNSGLTPADIDKVFITGGTGQSPYIRHMLTNIFQETKISDGEVFQSVINGLAKFALLEIQSKT